jgi:hypothetical protein
MPNADAKVRINKKTQAIQNNSRIRTVAPPEAVRRALYETATVFIELGYRGNTSSSLALFLCLLVVVAFVVVVVIVVVVWCSVWVCICCPVPFVFGIWLSTTPYVLSRLFLASHLHPSILCDVVDILMMMMMMMVVVVVLVVLEWLVCALCASRMFFRTDVGGV